MQSMNPSGQLGGSSEAQPACYLGRLPKMVILVPGSAANQRMAAETAGAGDSSVATSRDWLLLERNALSGRAKPR